jgi:hypothetical protein
VLKFGAWIFFSFGQLRLVISTETNSLGVLEAAVHLFDRRKFVLLRRSCCGISCIFRE